MIYAEHWTGPTPAARAASYAHAVNRRIALALVVFFSWVAL